MPVVQPVAAKPAGGAASKAKVAKVSSVKRSQKSQKLKVEHFVLCFCASVVLMWCVCQAVMSAQKTMSAAVSKGAKGADKKGR